MGSGSLHNHSGVGVPIVFRILAPLEEYVEYDGLPGPKLSYAGNYRSFLQYNFWVDCSSLHTPDLGGKSALPIFNHSYSDFAGAILYLYATNVR